MTKTIAEVLVNQVISRFGVSLKLRTDQGKNFYSLFVISVKDQKDKNYSISSPIQWDSRTSTSD